jgi:hypothetical protein
MSDKLVELSSREYFDLSASKFKKLRNSDWRISDADKKQLVGANGIEK